jgi:hypothetical protein
MTSSNSLSNTILQSSDNTMPEMPDIFSTNTTPDVSSSSSGPGFFEGLQNMNPFIWILIILILAFLGFNIFVYLAKGTETLNSVFSPIINMFSGIFGDTVGQVVDVSAEGTKKIVNTTAGAIDAGLSEVQKITPNKASSSVSSVPVTKNQPDVMSNNSLNKALNTSQSSQSPNNEYQADEASSSIQSGPPKSGWCYIGEDRGFRTCAEVGPNDKCISGDIFPSQDLCVNPNLRA